MTRRAALVLAALTLGSCARSSATELLVVVDSDLAVPDQLGSVRVDIEGLSTGPVSAIGELTGVRGRPLPRSVGVVYEGGPLGPLTVRAAGFLGDAEVVSRAAQVSFVPGHTKVLALELSESCVGVTCEASETCEAAACRSIVVDPDELVEYVPNDGDAGACLAGEICNGEDDDCDGRIDEDPDVERDPESCGECGHRCTAPANALATCSAGACGFACLAAFEDCNADASDGCERRIDTLTDCGACGAACALDHATATCALRSCAIAACADGFGDCDEEVDTGCEADLTREVTCGSCDVSCAAGDLCIGGRCRDPHEVIAIDGGASHTCALLAGGGVACWGSDADGQLGDGSTARRLAPYVIPSITDAIALAAGGAHSCAVRASGAVLCWGRNDNGQSGNIASSPNVSTPTEVRDITDAIAITAGLNHTCALRQDGGIACWGKNDRGQLGRSSSDTGTPGDVPLPAAARAVAAGDEHTCALLASGEVVCWGRNDRGQLGAGGPDGPMVRSVSDLTGAVALAAGGKHTCAVLGSGEIACWGENASGELGTGGDARAHPVGVPSISDATGVAAGTSHTCALRRSGAVVCFGDDSAGQLGDGGGASSTPVASVGLTDAVAIGAGAMCSCAARANGRASCWGDNDAGQIGDGTTAQREVPTDVANLP